MTQEPGEAAPAGVSAGRRPVVLAVLATTLFWLVIGGGTLLLWRRVAPITFAVQPPPATATPAPTATPPLLVVEVAGAVVAPGVFHLPPGSRVQDAVEAARGPTENADLAALNLASPLQDGSKLVVPSVGSPPPLAAVTTLSATPRLGVLANPAAGGPLLNLNTATAAELEALPGIGPKMAQAILDYRQANGRFKSVEDLLNVKGIGEATLAKIRDLVTVVEAP